MSSNSPDPAVLAALRALAQERGFRRLADELGTTRVTLGSYFAGTAVPGTVLLLETRFRALQAKPEAVQ